MRSGDLSFYHIVPIGSSVVHFNVFIIEKMWHIVAFITFSEFYVDFKKSFKLQKLSRKHHDFKNIKDGNNGMGATL